jgi:hypothetical protein
MRAGVERPRQIRIHGEPFDLLTGMSLSITPNTPGYVWITDGLPSVNELPLCNVGWIRAPVRYPVQPVELCTVGDRGLLNRRARAYLASVEGAISGQRGHNRTFRVACILTQKLGLSFEEAWPLFLEWNERCEPFWSQRELLHKLQDATKRKSR